MNCADVEAEARESRYDPSSLNVNFRIDFSELKHKRLPRAAGAAVAGLPNVEVTSIVGEELLSAGLNAIHTVGRASLVAPRLVVLKLTPSDPAAAAAAAVGLVGKGIVYDTGGLNLKGNGGRLMKCDMAGAAGIIGSA
jgi:leucyl aminopeptidase